MEQKIADPEIYFHRIIKIKSFRSLKRWQEMRGGGEG
jgi:hypothetical protein